MRSFIRLRRLLAESATVEQAEIHDDGTIRIFVVNS